MFTSVITSALEGILLDNNRNEKKEPIEQLPLLPLRGALTYPNMVLRIDVGRDKSVAALAKAMAGDHRMLVVAQRNASEDDPHIEDMYGVGTIVKVKQMVHGPDDTMRVLLEGQSRALLLDILEQGEFQLGLVKSFDSLVKDDDLKIMAHLRVMKRLARSYMKTRNIGNTELVQAVDGSEDADLLCDALAQHLLTSLKDKQEILESRDVMVRMQAICRLLSRELQLSQLENSIHEQVSEQMDKHQREYYLHEQIKVIQKELGDGEDLEREQLRQRLDASQMNETARAKAEAELKRLGRIAPGSPEGSVSRNYLDALLDMPWARPTPKKLDIAKARKTLDRDHEGLEKVKQRIVEYLAVSGLRGDLQGPILCLVGPPGVGKTSIAQSVARALGRPFVRVSLGGMRDEAEIRGHRRTYIGAIPGRIIAGIKQAGARNPVFLLDEIDKLGNDFRGDPASALLEALDPAQNATFTDHYLEAPFDLSQVLFITTANGTEGIPAPLLDRMELIRLPGYTAQEKAAIAKKHLWPKQIESNGLKGAGVKITKAAIDEVVEGYTREAGVRTLDRELAQVARKAAIRWMEDRAPIKVDADDVPTYLGPRRFTRDAIAKAPEAGQVNGLAWTSVGGETLTVEAVCLPGTGKVDLTGQLGDVMQESARAALSYIRSQADVLHIEPDFYKKCDLHIHVPEGATPKDGPSAGVALACAMVSAITKRPARQDVAMTGEITLRGRVLPIGGVKEKLLAAHRMGIKEVLLPMENEKDLDELPTDVRKALKVKLIGRVEQAIGTVLN